MTALPDVMWFGTTEGEWPIQCWESETHARSWAAAGDGLRKRRIWQAKLSRPVEYVLKTPDPYLEPKNSAEKSVVGAQCPTCGSTSEPLSTNGSPSGMLCENSWHAETVADCVCGFVVSAQRTAPGPHHQTHCPWHRFGR